MRILTSLLMLASIATSCVQAAENYTAQSTLRFVALDTDGSRGIVQEYDGKQYDGVEADLNFVTSGKKAYLDLGVNSLNSADEDGYFDLNLGSYLSVKGKFSILTHRQPNLKIGVIMNGRFVSSLDTNTDLNTTLVPLATDYTSADHLLMKRTESAVQAVISLPNNPDMNITAGFWQENETGSGLARYASRQLGAKTADINRRTTDVSAGINSAIGEGALATEFTQRNFKDFAELRVTAVSGGYNTHVVMPIAPDQVMNLYDVRFRTGADAAVPVTAAFSARTRTNEHTNYAGSAYSATLASSFKPGKNSYINAKVYGRATSVYENTSVKSDLGAVGEKAIDRYNLSFDLNGRYEVSDKMNLRAGFKVAHNYRKNAAHYTEEFAKDAYYQDGTRISSYTQTNAVATHDTQQVGTVGFDIVLPFDSELDVKYQKMRADRAVFEALATDNELIEASFNVPLPANLTLVTSAGYLSERNRKSNLTNTSSHQNSYNGGLEWSGSARVSAGVDYAYEQASYRGTGYFGAASNPTGAVWLTNLIREPGMLYRYENNVYGYHARVKLPKGFSLTGNGSYTVSRGAVPVNLTPFRITTPNAAVVTNLAPSDVRIARGAVALKYSPAKYKDLSARLGYSRDQWIDKVVSANSGWANLVTLSASAKF